jgi:SOS response regulatory protein OraA/RecX
VRPQIKKIEGFKTAYCELYLDDEFVCKIDRLFARSELISWDVASKTEFFERFLPLEKRFAMVAACNRLARQQLHSCQLIKSLKERFYSEIAIVHTIGELVRLGMINDEDYEASFVKKLQKQGKSRRQITLKASEKGISTKKLVCLLAPEEEALKTLIEKRYPILLQKDVPFATRQKALGALQRRGFSYSVISSYLKEE